jgi:hypothetical protein
MVLAAEGRIDNLGLAVIVALGNRGGVDEIPGWVIDIYFVRAITSIHIAVVLADIGMDLLVIINED